MLSSNNSILRGYLLGVGDRFLFYLSIMLENFNYCDENSTLAEKTVMGIVKWIVAIYSLISLLCLFNSGIRHLFLKVLDELYGRFVRLNKKFYKVKAKDYINCIPECIGDLLIIFMTFTIAPIVIIYHIPSGGFK